MYKIAQTCPNTPTPNLYPASQPMPQKYVHNYVIDYGRVIGKGNFSTVYAAFNKNKPTQRLAAKIVNISNMKIQKIPHLLTSEIDILLSLHHQNIISCKDIFVDENWSYIITEYCEGTNLQMKLVHNGLMNQPQALKIIKDVFNGLLHLEKNHIIHRDIKVANIFLRGNGDAVIADFGFACRINQPFHDLNIGSLPFMAPQSIINSFYTQKNDVWSFGVLVYHLFHGQSPYARSHTVQELKKNVLTPITIQRIKPQLSSEMKNLILSCLQINASKRPSFAEIQESWYFKNLFSDEKVVVQDMDKTRDLRKHYSVRKNPSPTSFSFKRIEFRKVLEEINYCRTLFKLISQMDSGQGKRKELFANHAAFTISKILNIIENDRVNYGLGNSESRKKKLKAVSEDYACEFKKEMRRKQIERHKEQVGDEEVKEELQNSLYECNAPWKVARSKEANELKKSLLRQLLGHDRKTVF